jgi:hypothetical protein
MMWISVRNKWPEEKGEYRVKDCRHNLEGTAKYDGYEWEEPNYTLPTTGSLLYQRYTITHWRSETEK